MTTTPTSENSCTLTNGITVPTTGTTPGQNGWDGSVCVISAFNTNPSSSAQGYEQTLTLLQFSDGTNTVATGTSKTLMLDQNTPGSNPPMPMLGYNLLIAQPNNLFPVASVGEMANLLTGQFPAISIPGPSPADSSTGINAFIFVQNLQAFPSSDMAQSFTTALNSASSSGSSSSIDSTMNAFFAETVSFQDVTFSAYVAAQSYVTAFAFAWANFASSYTYYVYTTGEATGSTTTGGTVSQLGTITFTQNAQSGIPSLTDPTGGYTITYQPVSGSSVQLTFANGQVVSAAAGDEPPAICLQGTFMNKSNATGNSSDYGTIIPGLAGTVYGQQAIATAYQQSLSSGTSGLQAFLSSGGWELTMDIMNIAMGVKALGELVGWVYGKASGWWNGSNQPDPPSPSDVASQADTTVAENEDVLEVANPNADVPDGTDLPTGQQNLQQEMIQLTNTEQAAGIQNELNAEADEIETELGFENNTTIESEAENLRTQETTLQEIDPSAAGASQQLSSLQASNLQLQNQITEENEAIETSVSQDEATALQNATAANQQAEEEEANEEKEEEDEEANEEAGDDGGRDEMEDV